LVIITGLGRCGTSILMKYLKEVGFNIGKNVNWHDEVRAGYELSTFYTIVDDLYHRYCKFGEPINLEDECLGTYWKGKSYKEAFSLIDNDDRQGKVDVVKDPRITWHPDIIEAIWGIRKDIKLIICHRDIESIYKSRKSLPIQYDDPKPRKSLMEYQVDFAEFYTRVLKLGIPYELMFFPDFLKDFEYLFFSLAKVELIHVYNKGYEVWEKLIDEDLLK